jgi:hypothetical protein
MLHVFDQSILSIVTLLKVNCTKFQNSTLDIKVRKIDTFLSGPLLVPVSHNRKLHKISVPCTLITESYGVFTATLGTVAE